MKVAVLLSGGVDSAVALRLLQQQDIGEVRAFYLKIWLQEELAFLGDCPWEEDLRFARAVCEQAGVALEVLSLQDDYFAAVVEPALRELRAGRTPSPDVFCNRHVKFGAFCERLGDRFDKVASGHYARVVPRALGYDLLRAPDPVKDQTYFLHRLTQAQLSRALFPIGHLRKAQVRALATDFNLANRTRPDSQGICFLGKIRYNDFVRYHLGEQPGPIVDGDTGKELGRHAGYWFHTIGQRQGLGLSGGPWYVTGKDVARNIVYVSHRQQLSAAARSAFCIGDVHWISGAAPRIRDVQLKLRHGPTLLPARLQAGGGGRWTVSLEVPDSGIAPGQSAVFYDGERCLGGGIIC
jgi:tRNA (5-methylaminomethyl-2-thiouridylate)-methyltransferase